MEEYYLSLLTALQKLFSKRERFAPPRKYKLNTKELESVLIFFAALFMIIVMSIFVVLQR
jgi:hypothetical protein